MPLDVAGAIYDQAWALLEGSPAFTAMVLPGNRLDEDRPLKSNQAQLQGSLGGGYPKVWLQVKEETDGEPLAVRTFGMNSVGTTMAEKIDYPVPVTINLLIECRYDNTLITQQTPLEAAVRGAMLLKGPTFGLHYVSKMTQRSPKRGVKKIDGTERYVTELRWSFQCNPYLSELTAGSYYL